MLRLKSRNKISWSAVSGMGGRLISALSRKRRCRPPNHATFPQPPHPCFAQLPLSRVTTPASRNYPCFNALCKAAKNPWRLAQVQYIYPPPPSSARLVACKVELEGKLSLRGRAGPRPPHRDMDARHYRRTLRGTSSFVLPRFLNFWHPLLGSASALPMEREHFLFTFFFFHCLPGYDARG